MKAFLSKISEFASVQEVLLLNNDAEILFSYPAINGNGSDSKQVHWGHVIEKLGYPENAEFMFDRGRYFLAKTEIGAILIGLKSDEHLRVIQEACRNIQAKLQDAAIRKNVLMRMFAGNRKSLQPQFIKALQSTAGPEVAAALIPILRQEKRLSNENKTKILVAVCKVLGHCRTKDSLKALREYLKTHAKTTDQIDDITQAAKIAVAQLELDNLNPTPEKGSDLESLGLEENNVIKAAIKSASPAEQEIQALVDQGKKREAIDRIMDLIISSAKKKQFARAEKFRELLVATDSMAIREIINAAEIIEEEKSSSLSDILLSTWQDLVDIISLDEFSALYYATQPKNSVDGEIIVEQGDFLSTLFLVNSGRVELYSTKHGRDIPFKSVSEGEIFGADSFFDISVWTFSVKSQGANLSLLTWDRMQTLKEDYPALKNKLMDYCTRFKSNQSHFNKPSTSRRKYERKELVGRATVDLLDKKGKVTGESARGDLIDISQGGIAFVLRFHKRKFAVDLLGKKIKITIRPDNSTSPIVRTGLVKAVRCHDFVGNDYSLHVEFEHILSSNEVAQATVKKN